MIIIIIISNLQGGLSDILAIIKVLVCRFMSEREVASSVLYQPVYLFSISNRLFLRLFFSVNVMTIILINNVWGDLYNVSAITNTIPNSSFVLAEILVGSP